MSIYVEILLDVLSKNEDLLDIINALVFTIFVFGGFSIFSKTTFPADVDDNCCLKFS